MERKKVALALGSGGARGIAHIGVIRELLAQNYEIASVAGTSIGALIGGVYAAGKLDEFEKWMTTRKTTDLISLLDFTLSRQGFVKAEKIMSELKKIIPDQKIEDLPVKFTAIATDIINKKEVVISSGSLYEAVRASVSFPVVFMPVHRNNTLYVDGGLLNPIPVNRIYRNENDFVVAVDLGANIPYSKEKEKEKKTKKEKTEEQISKRLNMNSIEILSELVEVVLGHVSDLNLQLSPPDVLVQIPKQMRSTFDFSDPHELVELGRAQTKKSLKPFQEAERNGYDFSHNVDRLKKITKKLFTN